MPFIPGSSHPSSTQPQLSTKSCVNSNIWVLAYVKKKAAAYKWLKSVATEVKYIDSTNVLEILMKAVNNSTIIVSLQWGDYRRFRYQNQWKSTWETTESLNAAPNLLSLWLIMNYLNLCYDKEIKMNQN